MGGRITRILGALRRRTAPLDDLGVGVSSDVKDTRHGRSIRRTRPDVMQTNDTLGID